MRNPIALALAGILCTSAAQAFEVTGGSVDLGFSAFTDDFDANKTTLGGALEFGIVRAVSVQADLGLTQFGLTEVDNTNFGLHGIYHLGEATSGGLYLGRDRVEGADIDLYGLEIGHQQGQFTAEGYLGHAEAAGGSGTLLGLRGGYALSDSATLGARYDNVNLEGYDISRLSLTGEYAMTDGFALNAEVGSFDAEGVGSEMFLGLGVKASFGAKRGATFERRSLVDLIPGG